MILCGDEAECVMYGAFWGSLPPPGLWTPWYSLTYWKFWTFLFQYEKEYFAMKDAERAAEDPLVRLERENKKLQVKTWPFL